MRERYMREGEVLSLHTPSPSGSQLLRVKEMSSVPIILVGNKCDLEYERRVGEQGLCASFVPLLLTL